MDAPIRGLRWRIALLLFASTVINYIDRQTISVMAPFLQRDYHWTNSDFATVLIAFRLGYTLMQGRGRALTRYGRDAPGPDDYRHVLFEWWRA